MSVFSCIDCEPFSLDNCVTYVCLSLKKKHSYKCYFLGVEVEVETMCLIVLTSIAEFLLVKYVKGQRVMNCMFPAECLPINR